MWLQNLNEQFQCLYIINVIPKAQQLIYSFIFCLHVKNIFNIIKKNKNIGVGWGWGWGVANQCILLI